MVEIDVSNGQNNLYRELLDYANDEGKSDCLFPMKNFALLSLTGLSEAGLKKARNELVQLGLIEYVKGIKGKKVPQYRIIKLYQDKQLATTSATRNEKSSSSSTDKVAQVVTQPEAQVVAHKELTTTDPDLTGTDSVVVDDTAANESSLPESKAKGQGAVDLWQNLWGFPNAVAMEDLSGWLTEFGDDLVSFVIRYAAKYNVQAKGADRYLERVFEGYRKEKIDTVAKAEEAAKKHEQRMKSSYSAPKRTYGRQPRKEEVPDWLAKQEAERKEHEKAEREKAAAKTPAEKQAEFEKNQRKVADLLSDSTERLKELRRKREEAKNNA
ncbi:hypothetical protein IV38_GL000094 [Lactobacillus selangorensis]|uniref:DnaB/C C-terminal domain-containing protein n=2 Tax=Lactobacillus selangorensis TaxID=81857 RepID=A0A0R2G3H9_9LACO|nr:hypothetical protein IV38_GL000094 [Lactobacillus selangorensis]KRN31428.1 hypothetical protein IV40_GL001424 [Lactobacillus selangorensis]